MLNVYICILTRLRKGAILFNILQKKITVYIEIVTVYIEIIRPEYFSKKNCHTIFQNRGAAIAAWKIHTAAMLVLLMVQNSKQHFEMRSILRYTYQV